MGQLPIGSRPLPNDDAEYEEENIGYPVSSVGNDSFVCFSLFNETFQGTIIILRKLLCVSNNVEREVVSQKSI